MRRGDYGLSDVLSSRRSQGRWLLLGCRAMWGATTHKSGVECVNVKEEMFYAELWSNVGRLDRYATT